MDGDEMEYYERLGACIRDVRTLRRMSQPQLGKLTGHAASTISMWESARSKPKAYDLYIISKALRVPPSLLIDPPARPISPVELALRERDGH